MPTIVLARGGTNLVNVDRALAGGHAEGVLGHGQDGAGCVGGRVVDEAASRHEKCLAVEKAGGAGGGRHRPDAVVHLAGRAGPVDQAVGLVDAAGVAGTLGRLRRARRRAGVDPGQRVDEEACAQSARRS
jgi:hypothetical protein